MIPVRIEIAGQSGSGKSATAASARGQWAALDIDNQYRLYTRRDRLPWLSPVAQMKHKFDRLVPGDAAVWHTSNPLEITPDRIVEFVGAAGLGGGDTFIIDPMSEYWTSLRMSFDLMYVAKKGEDRVDMSRLKAPLIRLLVTTRNLPCDVIYTSRMKMEFAKDPETDKVMPTGRYVPDGERQRMDYDVMFRFMIAVNDMGKHTLTAVKGKAGLVTIGQKWRGGAEDPILLREVLAEIYNYLDGVEAKYETVNPLPQEEGMADDTPLTQIERCTNVEQLLALKNSDVFVNSILKQGKSQRKAIEAAFNAAHRRLKS